MQWLVQNGHSPNPAGPASSTGNGRLDLELSTEELSLNVSTSNGAGPQPLAAFQPRPLGQLFDCDVAAFASSFLSYAQQNERDRAKRRNVLPPEQHPRPAEDSSQPSCSGLSGGQESVWSLLRRTRADPRYAQLYGTLPAYLASATRLMSERSYPAQHASAFLLLAPASSVHEPIMNPVSHTHASTHRTAPGHSMQALKCSSQGPIPSSRVVKVANHPRGTPTHGRAPSLVAMP